jgi:hypothetical protein
MAYLCSQQTTNFIIKYFMFHCSICRLFLLNTGCKRDSLQMIIFVNFCSTWRVVQLKARVETWITRNDVNSVCFTFLFKNTYGLPVLSMDTECCNQGFYVDFSIYILLVLNRTWKLDSLQIMLFAHVFLTWSTVQLKTCLETWITTNDVNGVSLFHLTYLITLMGYLSSQRTPNVQMKYFSFDWLNYRLLVVNRGWKGTLSK